MIGLIKRDLADSAVRITPFLEDVEALLDAGAASSRWTRPTGRGRCRRATCSPRSSARGAVAMADISTEAEARAAIAAGADIVGTTMSGYTGPGPTPAGPDLGLVGHAPRLGAPVLAEGRYNAPPLAAAAIRAGATAVVVGSAITRPEHITTWFRAAVEAAALPERPALAFDIGGTKTLAALVRGREVLDRRMVATAREIGAPGWIDGVAGLAADWARRLRAGGRRGDRGRGRRQLVVAQPRHAGDPGRLSARTPPRRRARHGRWRSSTTPRPPPGASIASAPAAAATWCS